MRKKCPSQEYLMECFDLFENTLFWKKRPKSHFNTEHGMKVFNGTYEGKKAGSVITCRSGKRYMWVGIGGKNYYSHRLIWIMRNGCINEVDEIDHIDGNGLNNSAENMRIVSGKENAKNHRMQKNNTSGVVGVSWAKDRSKWYAFISVGKKKKKCLGFYDDIEMAKQARIRAEVELGYHENHGKKRSL